MCVCVCVCACVRRKGGSKDTTKHKFRTFQNLNKEQSVPVIFSCSGGLQMLGTE